MPSPTQPFTPNELFSFTRLAATPVLDVAVRLAAEKVPSGQAARERWAQARLDAKDAPRGPEDLRFGYADLLKPGFALQTGRQPGRDDLRNPDTFDGQAVRDNPAWREDLRRLRQHFLAVMIAGDKVPAAERTMAARLVQLVEGFPQTAQRGANVGFAPVLIRQPARAAAGAPRRAAAAVKPGPAATRAAELGAMAAALRELWSARDARLATLDQEFRAALAKRSEIAIAPPEPPKKGGRSQGKAKARSAKSKTASKAFAARRAAAKQIEAARQARRMARTGSGLAAVLAKPAGLFGKPPSNALQKLIDQLGKLGGKHDVPLSGFCQAYAKIHEELDRIDGALPAPPVVDPEPEHFDAPAVSFADSVQMLGKAELVRVDEQFVGYSAAEVSYIQTVLPGERRVRKTRSANVQETSLELLEEELAERTDETSASTKNELKSEIETELRSRFDSNVSASGSGEGGGSVGLVNFSGSGSISADLGVGVDAGFRSRNESQFTQEILRKAVERTNRRTLERRVSRTRQSYSASDFHEITNAGDEMLNGTYVFLNKHVAITETVFGVRAFLEAKLLLPGRSLVAARRSLQRIAEDRIGERPRFAITPADITPANYMRLAGEFRASNVEPPPAPVTTLTRVYKTDSAAASSAPDTFNGRKLADILVPFYGRYQRYVITDNVELPEGYDVLDVDVAVSHGANGVSLPAHLPLTLPGTAFYAGVSFMPFVMGLLGIAFLPAWVWSVAFMGSPLLHYNTDSSNVTVTIGTEAQDSAYYFFEPDDLLELIMELLRAISAASPQFLQRLGTIAGQRIQEMQTAAAEVPVEMAGRIRDSIEDAVGKVRRVLDHLTANPPRLGDAAAEVTSVGSADLTLGALDELDDVFTPLRNFVGDLSDLLEDTVGDAISATVSAMLARLENNQRLDFTQSLGLRGKLPVAINALALNPGVTITVAACLKRSPEAIARWQLRTFESFYQAYLQQVAVWENAHYSGAPKPSQRSPGLMRRDERVALKERVIAALHARHSPPDQSLPIARLELFEHAIDWDSLSYRLFDYGPSERMVELESSALLTGADEDRRRFLLASWAQVMIPLQPNEGLIAQFLDYLAGGGGSVAAAVGDGDAEIPELDELAALYRDLVLNRPLQADPPPVGEPRFVTLPTDLVALYRPDLADLLPRNPAFPAP